MISRYPNILKLLNKNKSVFLLGPRGTGKTALIKSIFKDLKESNQVQIDLLQGKDFQRYLNNPSQITSELEEILRNKTNSELLFVSIDEIQRIPALLNDVHYLIEKYKNKIVFLLTGSSARKLKRGGANLLAGRAISCHLFPLNQLEIELYLNKALQFGTLPEIYFDTENLQIPILESYVSSYLREEIQQESLVRGIDRFSQFLEFASQNNAEPVNLSKLGKQLKIAGKTVADYYSILVDTLIAKEIRGWSHSIKRQLLQAPKYYFFDCGVLNAMNGYLRVDLKPSSFLFGKLFENFIVNQLICSNEYLNLGLKFYYWRDKLGAEVDLILARNLTEPLLAIEIKSHNAPTAKECPGFHYFMQDYPKVRKICVCTTPRLYRDDGIEFVPWQRIIRDLGEYLSS